MNSLKKQKKKKKDPHSLQLQQLQGPSKKQ